MNTALSHELKALGPPSCFTDSKVALFWIRGCEREWNQFVENHVREIRRLTPVAQWMHCPGVDNPADLPSRESDLDELVSNQLWLHGPKWQLNSTGMGDLNSNMEDSVLNP